MATPTLETRRRRRVLVMSAAAQTSAMLKAALAPDWECVEALDFEALGGFEDVLQLRFILVDLEARGVWDPVETIVQVRTQLMVNVPILCCGGDAPERSRARSAGADRCFERAELVAQVPEYCRQFGW